MNIPKLKCSQVFPSPNHLFTWYVRWFGKQPEAVGEFFVMSCWLPYLTERAVSYLCKGAYCKLQQFPSFSNFSAFENWMIWRSKLHGFTTVNNLRTNRILIAYVWSYFSHNQFMSLSYVGRQTTPYKINYCLKNWLARLFYNLLAWMCWMCIYLYPK